MAILGFLWRSMHHGGPSAAEPQPNRQEIFTTKHTKITKFGDLKYPKPFVSFVNFVVRPYFLIEHSNIGTVARKFAQSCANFEL